MEDIKLVNDGEEANDPKAFETPNPLEDKIKALEEHIMRLENNNAELASRVNDYETKEFYGSLDFMSEGDLDKFKSLDLPLDTKRGLIDFLKVYRKPQDTSEVSSIVSDNNDNGYEYTNKPLNELL